jgi:RNA polymerase sigma-70 factor (ECF subfamily)
MALANSTPVLEEPSEPWLIAAARGGSADALGALYERHATALLALAYRLLQSVPDAEDVVHDVFVGLPEALRRYQERGTFSAWLRTVTARVALARLRQAATRDLVSLEAGGEPAAPRRDLEGVISLDTAMRRLAPSLRAVLVLKEIEGFTHAEIARMLEISVGASEVRLHRAVAALRAALVPPREES